MQQHHEGFGHMLVHFVADYFHYDNKFWTTLRYLLFYPGKLTRMYLDGKRASFLNPIQLYIFVSAVFFIVFLNSLHFYIDEKGKLQTIKFYVGKEHVAENLHAEFNCDSIEKQRNGMVAVQQESDSLYHVTKPSLSFSYLTILIGRNLSQYSLIHSLYTNGSLIRAEMNIFIRSIPKMFFILMPWFALLLKLFFSRRKFLYVDHAVFSLHFHSFVFISVMIGVLQYFTFASSISFVFTLVVPIIYFIAALRNVYRNSWIYTVMVGGLVGSIYLMSLLIVAVINVIIVMLIS